MDDTSSSAAAERYKPYTPPLYSVPQLRDTDDARLDAVRKSLGGRTEALEDSAIEMYARGLSTKDIEAFATRDLSEIRPLYLFLDGVAERLCPYLINTRSTRSRSPAKK